MSGGKGKVVVDAEAVLAWLEELTKCIEKGRCLFSAAFTSKPLEVPVDLSKIQWKLKGGVDASSDDAWAWAFAYDQNGAVKPETRQLVEAIKAHGTVTIGGFEVKLGGRDQRLLQRKKL